MDASPSPVRSPSALPARDGHPARDAGTAPHPVLTRHYAGPAERERFVTRLFDDAARDYDWLCSAMSLGSGLGYRRGVLRRAGLVPGMTLVDVATGTGLVARAALDILGRPEAVVGIDPSRGMLARARGRLPVRLVQGCAEALPFPEASFDFLSMGYALRHVADLELAFGEWRRVLRPGGRVVILEISRPRSRVMGALLRLHLTTLLPGLARLRTRRAEAAQLTRYYWDTIAACVAPETILDALRRSGFIGVERRLRGGLLSEYLATRPAR